MKPSRSDWLALLLELNAAYTQAMHSDLWDLANAYAKALAQLTSFVRVLPELDSRSIREQLAARVTDCQLDLFAAVDTARSGRSQPRQHWINHYWERIDAAFNHLGDALLDNEQVPR